MKHRGNEGHQTDKRAERAKSFQVHKGTDKLQTETKNENDPANVWDCLFPSSWKRSFFGIGFWTLLRCTLNRFVALFNLFN